MSGNGLPGVKNRDDVRMHQPGRGHGLAAESICKTRFIPQLYRQQFDGHGSPQLLLESPVNRPHASPPNEGFNLKIRQQHGEVLKGRHRTHPIPRGSFRLQSDRHSQNPRRIQTTQVG